MGSKKEWFGQWFNSKYYHILYKHRDHEEARMFIDSLINHLALNKNSLIMDLACGKGRHSIYFNNKGFRVVGLDLSEKNIVSAKKHENNQLHFYTHDMRNNWSKNEFDCVLNLFTSFGYFDTESEDLQAIKAVAGCLKSGGKFILDFLNPYTVIHHLVAEEIKIVDGIEFHINKDVSDGFIVKDITFSDNGIDYSYHEKVRAIRRVKFLEYFEDAGLTLIEIFGDYELNPYIAEKSERMIFHLKK